MASMKREIRSSIPKFKAINKSSHMEELAKWSHMEQLAKWIVNVRQKKLKCHKTPKRNFRMEAVLTHALHKAEYEFRAKQLSRMSRWRRLRKDLLKDVDYGSCGLYNATERELEEATRRDQIGRAAVTRFQEPYGFSDYPRSETSMEQGTQTCPLLIQTRYGMWSEESY